MQKSVLNLKFLKTEIWNHPPSTFIPNSYIWMQRSNHGFKSSQILLNVEYIDANYQKTLIKQFCFHFVFVSRFHICFLRTPPTAAAITHVRWIESIPNHFFTDQHHYIQHSYKFEKNLKCECNVASIFTIWGMYS